MCSCNTFADERGADEMSCHTLLKKVSFRALQVPPKLTEPKKIGLVTTARACVKVNISTIQMWNNSKYYLKGIPISIWTSIILWVIQ